MGAEVMTPEHPRWKEFAERLEGPEGCNFKDDGKGKEDSITWECKGGRDQSKCRAILGAMPEIDIGKSLVYFDEHGGYCDCEVLFNVNPDTKD